MSSPQKTARKTSARVRLLNAAAKLFYNDGIVSTGIDAITAKAGVAKMSLYNNYASKTELVHAYIDERHQEWLALYHSRVKDAQTPTARVLAVFDAYQDHAEDDYDRGFRGCGILNAAAELPVGEPGRVAVRRHKEEVESLVQKHLMEFPNMTADRAKALAEHMAFLLEGSIMRAGLEQSSTRVCHARKIAADLLSAL